MGSVTFLVVDPSGDLVDGLDVLFLVQQINLVDGFGDGNGVLSEPYDPGIIVVNTARDLAVGRRGWRIG